MLDRRTPPTARRLALTLVAGLAILACDGASDARPAATAPGAQAVAASGEACADPAPAASAAPLRVAAWYAGWFQNDLPPDAIDFEAVTQLMHFMVVPRPDGSLRVEDRPGFESPERIASVVDAAHAAGRPVLVSVGGAGSYSPGFKEAIALASVDALVANLAAFVAEHGYDGVDVDMEPILPDDVAQLREFIRRLRAALAADALLTVAAPRDDNGDGSAAAIFVPVEPLVDQFNIMTYDISGAYEGWETWHNSPISNGGRAFQTTPGRALPSAALSACGYIRAGIPRAKVGIGVDFYGYVWRGGAGTDTGGVTAPNQTWTQPPAVAANVPYSQLHRQYDVEAALWDADAQAAYLSLDTPEDAADEFVSFDNERTVRAKVAFASELGIGGIAIWELAGGYLRDPTLEVRDPLLQAVKEALGTRP